MADGFDDCLTTICVAYLVLPRIAKRATSYGVNVDERLIVVAVFTLCGYILHKYALETDSAGWHVLWLVIGILAGGCWGVGNRGSMKHRHKRRVESVYGLPWGSKEVEMKVYSKATGTYERSHVSVRELLRQWMVSEFAYELDIDEVDSSASTFREKKSAQKAGRQEDVAKADGDADLGNNVNVAAIMDNAGLTAEYQELLQRAKVATTHQKQQEHTWQQSNDCAYDIDLAMPASTKPPRAPPRIRRVSNSSSSSQRLPPTLSNVESTANPLHVSDVPTQGRKSRKSGARRASLE